MAGRLESKPIYFSKNVKKFALSLAFCSLSALPLAQPVEAQSQTTDSKLQSVMEVLKTDPQTHIYGEFLRSQSIGAEFRQSNFLSNYDLSRRMIQINEGLRLAYIPTLEAIMVHDITLAMAFATPPKNSEDCIQANINSFKSLTNFWNYDQGPFGSNLIGSTTMENAAINNFNSMLYARFQNPNNFDRDIRQQYLQVCK